MAKSKEEQKAELTVMLKEEYQSTTTEKWGWVTTVTYAGITGHSKKQNQPLNKYFSFKRDKEIYFLFAGISIVMILSGLFSKPDVASGETVNINIFYGVTGLIITTILLIKRKKILYLDEQGIYYYKWNNLIEWDAIGAIYKKTTVENAGEDQTITEELIIHHYSRYNHFVYDVIDITAIRGKAALITSIIIQYWDQ